MNSQRALAKRIVLGVVTLGTALSMGACQTASQPASPSSVPSAGAAAVAGPAGDIRAPQMEICHVTGTETFQLINISANAWPAHHDHGDHLPGDAVPGSPGMVFDDHCQPVVEGPSAQLECPCWDSHSEQDLVSVLDSLAVSTWTLNDFGSVVVLEGKNGSDNSLATMTATELNTCSFEIKNLEGPVFIQSLSPDETLACLSEVRAISQEVGAAP